MLSWITLLAPIALELLKIFTGKDQNAKAAAKEELLAAMARIRAAVQKAEDTGGDTSAIEDIINKK